MNADNIEKIRLIDNVNEVGLFHKLSIFEDNNIEAQPTDLVLLSGGAKDSQGFTPYWTNTSGRDHIAVITSSEYTDDKHYSCFKTALQPAIRPVLNVKTAPNVEEIQFGEYPQSIETDEDIIVELETVARRKKLFNLTNKSYSLIGNKLYPEYVYNDNKYIAIESKTDGEVLSNGTLTQRGKTYWVKVEPVTWLVDQNAKVLVSKYGLLSGISYFGTKDSSKFEDSNINEFITTKMLQDISYVSEIRKVSDYNSFLSTNPFNLSTNELTDNERIQKLVRSGISPFLHGQTGVGKSARVKQEDDDVTVIYLCNQTLDSLNGKAVYVPPLTKRIERKVQVEENGQIVEKTEWVDTIIQEGAMKDVKPSWLIKLEEKCMREPEKIHIVFFDEITNAMPAIQGFCFNIILNREVNGIWKLPDNARVVAAGNELDDSIAANELAEPLFSRFAHIYIDDNAESWLNWANKNGIHPAIIAFSACFNGKNLRTRYNGKTPNADPRKWEMASKVLYKTGNINLLEGLLGSDLTKSFNQFCNCKTVTVEDVINHNYSDITFRMDANNKFVTALTLSSVDMDNFEEVYDFMMKVGPEPCAVFESLWVGNDEEKQEKLLEVKMKYRADRENKVRSILLDKSQTDQVLNNAQGDSIGQKVKK